MWVYWPPVSLKSFTANISSLSSKVGQNVNSKLKTVFFFVRGCIPFGLHQVAADEKEKATMADPLSKEEAWDAGKTLRFMQLMQDSLTSFVLTWIWTQCLNPDHNTTSKINLCSVARFLSSALIRMVVSLTMVLFWTWQLFMVSFPFWPILFHRNLHAPVTTQSTRFEQTFFTALTVSQHQVKVC